MLQRLRTYYKPIITLVVVILVMGGDGHLVNAAEACMADDASQSSYLAGVIIRLLSWLWFIPAVLAGKLMSNDLIYGQIVGLETFFYQFWSLIRTIANFTLVAIIVILIGKIVIGKAEAWSTINKYSIRLLLSGILINSSWFVMAMLVDLSTIAVTEVGQISNAYMSKVLVSDSDNVRVLNEQALSIPTKIRIDDCGCIETENSKPTMTFDQITQNHNEISGPLIFMGAGIMKLQAYSLNVGCGTSTNNEIGKLTLKAILQLMMLAMFVIPLIVLVAVNLIRLIYIRGWIIFSPLIVLYNLFMDVMDERGLSGYKDSVSLSNIIAGLLQPVATVTALTIGMMLITGIYSAVSVRERTEDNTFGAMNGVVNKLDGSMIIFGTNSKIGSVTIKDNLISDPSGTIGGGFGYLLVAFATCFVMRMMVKMSFMISAETFKDMDINGADLMEKLNGSLMKKIKLPERGGPLGGASLDQATTLLDPTSKDNHILKTINNRSDKLVQNAQDHTKRLTETSWLGNAIGLNDNGDLASPISVPISPISSDRWKKETKDLFSKIKNVADDSTKKTFVADRTDRNLYQTLEKWYKDDDGGGKAILNSLQLYEDKAGKIVSKGTEGATEVKFDDFNTEYEKHSYLGGLVKHLVTANELEMTKVGDKTTLKREKPSKDRLSKIDFKGL